MVYHVLIHLHFLTVEPIDKCSLPKDEGGCDSAIIKWYYNGERCEQFYYRGCKGNANRFESRRECEKSCMPSVIKGKLCLICFIIQCACKIMVHFWPVAGNQRKKIKMSSLHQIQQNPVIPNFAIPKIRLFRPAFEKYRFFKLNIRAAIRSHYDLCQTENSRFQTEFFW